jgi:hypothetical protein
MKSCEESNPFSSCSCFFFNEGTSGSKIKKATVLTVATTAMNVEINLPSLPDDDPLRGEATKTLGELLADLEDRDRALRTAVGGRIG